MTSERLLTTYLHHLPPNRPGNQEPEKNPVILILLLCASPVMHYELDYFSFTLFSFLAMKLKMSPSAPQQMFYV